MLVRIGEWVLRFDFVFGESLGLDIVLEIFCGFFCKNERERG